jgi:hypothetical protein
MYDDWVKRCIRIRMEVDGNRPRARDRTKKTWMKTLKGDMIRYALSQADAKDASVCR